jgi:hypothetical protein
VTTHNWCPFCCFALWKYTIAVHKRRKMYIKLVALYCNMVSSLVPKTYCSVTHIMMQFLSALLCVYHTHRSNYFICIHRARKISQYGDCYRSDNKCDCYRSDNKCGSDMGFSLCRHICHSAISSTGAWVEWQQCQGNHWQPCWAQVKNAQAEHLHYPHGMVG